MSDKPQHAREPGDGKEVVKAQPAAPVQPPGGFHLPGLPSLPSVNPDQVGEILRATPGLLKVAAGAWWRGAEWMVKTSVRTGLSVARELANGEPAATVIRHQTAELRSAAWHLLGMDEETDKQGVPEHIALRGATNVELIDQGKELLRRSADVRATVDTHPAYARILGDLTPDEARILRLLFVKGPQPSIDVRTNRPLGIGSERIYGGLNMIGEYAGITYQERIHPYLTNLNRLGLVVFSKEKVEPNRYQLIEAQPKTTEVLKRAGRAPRIVHRRIELSQFGEDFCAACLPTEGWGFTRPSANGDTPAE